LRIEVVSNLTQGLELPVTTPTTVSPLRQRMIEDMIAPRLVPGTQVGHVRACKRFAAWLKRSPETATADDLRSFQLHLTETGVSATTRNRTMTACVFCSASRCDGSIFCRRCITSRCR
jgi:integrase/recombinase XerD